MQSLPWKTRILLQGARICRDQRGVSAIEFAMLMPMFILLYVATAEIGNLHTVMRRVETVASTAADLTAQVKKVSSEDLADIVAASTSILTPYEPTSLTVVLSSVVTDSDNHTTVDWSYSNNGSGNHGGDEYELPTGTTEPNSSVIVAEVEYAFTPLIDLENVFSTGPLNLKRTFYARPRKSLTVEKID